MRITRNILTLFAMAACVLTAEAKKAEQPFVSIDGKMYYPQDFFNPYFEAYLLAEDKANFTPEKYLDTFIDNIVLYNQAHAPGIDTLASLQRTVNNYTNLAIAPYNIDQQAVERLSREAADRSKEDVRVSHILIPVPWYAFEKDSLDARARIDSVYQALKSGTPFDTLAVKINPGGSTGDLGFITAFQLPYALETAAYQTPVGEFSAPVRTEFGYHIVRPVERRPARGMVELAHILVMRKDSDSLDTRALADIRRAYSRLKEGDNFADVALNYTEDAATQANGGYLGFYSIGELLPEIEDMVFALEPGQTTSILALPDCWEIIQVVNKVRNDDYEARKDFLNQQVLAGDRFTAARRAYAEDKLKTYPLRVDSTQYEKVVETLSNMGFLWGEWKSGYVENAHQPLFTLGDSTFTTSDFYNSLIYDMDKYDERSELRRIIQDKFEDFASSMALGMYVRNLPQTDERIKSSVEEFRRKAIIQMLTDAFCAERLSEVDPDTLMALYNQDTTRYLWGQRAHYQVVMCRDAATAERARQMMQQGRDYREVLSLLNKGLVSVVEGYELTEETARVFKPDFEIRLGASDIIQEGDNYFVFNILELFPPQRKTYEQALGEVREDYYALCAERYPALLRKGHSVEVFKKQLKALNKAVNAEKKKRGIE